MLIDYFEPASLDNRKVPPVFLMEHTLRHITDDQAFKDESIVPLAKAVKEIETVIGHAQFGMAVMIEDICQLRVLSGSEDIRRLIASGKLAVRLTDTYGVPVNALMMTEHPETALKPYHQVIRISGGKMFYHIEQKEVQTYRVREVLDAYKKERRSYSVGRPDVSRAYLWIKQIEAENRGFIDKTCFYQAMAAEAKLQLKQAVAAAAILCDLDLIQFDKSDMIKGKIITCHEKKDLEESRIFSALNEGR